MIASLWDQLTWIAPIGDGSQATVWQVAHEPTQRTLAAKVVRRAGRSWSSVHTEARLLAGLDHPNVVDVYDLLPLDAGNVPDDLRSLVGEPCLLMEFADAGTLADRRTARWPLAAFVGLCRDLLRGLGHVAGHGWLHLDVKPENVLLFESPGGVVARLADFGVGQRSEEASSAGTAAFAAPEQRDGRPRLARTDLFAAGRVLATLQRDSGTPEQRRAVDAWLERLQAPGPDDRFASAAHAFAALIDGLACDEPAGAWAAPMRPLARAVVDATQPVLAPMSAPALAPPLQPLARASLDVVPSLRPVDELRRERPRIGDGFALLDARRTRVEGRAEELAQVRRCLEQARAASRFALIEVAGPVGVGVTRFVDAAAALAHEDLGAVVVEGRGRVAPTVEASVAQLANGASGLTLVTVDDAALTPAVTAGLQARASATAAVVVICSRPSALRRIPGVEPALRLTLAPLSEPSIRALLARSVRLDDRVAQSIAEQAFGRPELALRTLRDWQRDGVIVPRGGAWVPATDALPNELPSGEHDLDTTLALALDGDHAAAWARLATLAEAALDASAAQRGLLALSWLAPTPRERRALAETLRARFLVAAGDLVGAAEALARADEHHATGLDAALREEVAVRIAATRGDVVTALERAQAMASAAERAGSRLLFERATIEQARAHVIRRESTTALARLDALGDLGLLAPALRFRVHSMRAHALIELGRADEAYPESHAAFHAGQGVVSPFALANGANDLGSCCAQLGRADEARLWFERSLELSRDRFPMAAYVHANLAALDLAADRQQDALRRLDRALGRFLASPLPRVGWLLRGLQVGALATLETREEWDQAIAAIVERGVDGIAFVESAEAAEFGAGAWTRLGDRERADRAWRLAVAMWQATGHADRAANAVACSNNVPASDH